MLQNDFINIFVSNLTSEDNFKGFINKIIETKIIYNLIKLKLIDYTLIYTFS